VLESMVAYTRLERYVDQLMVDNTESSEGGSEQQEQQEEDATEQSDGGEYDSFEEAVDDVGSGTPPFVSEGEGTDPSPDSHRRFEKREFESKYRILNQDVDPYRFHVFRDEEKGLVQSWTFMRYAELDGMHSMVPVATGSIPENGGGDAVWHEYHRRDMDARDDPERPTFVFAEKEEIIPSNAFWRYIKDVSVAMFEFEEQMAKIDDHSSVDMYPDFPEPYGELAEYEQQVAEFFVQVLYEYHELTKEMSELTAIALKKFDESEWLDGRVDE